MQTRREVNEKRADTAGEKRRAPRAELSIEVGIDDHTNFYVGFSENISTGGVFIATYRLLPVGAEVALTFVLPDEFPVFVHGRVRWTRDSRDSIMRRMPRSPSVSDDTNPKSRRVHVRSSTIA